MCNNFVIDLLQEFINFVRLSHRSDRSVNELLTIMQQNRIAYAASILFGIWITC